MNIFDIMGPVMVGPSSSHTAGVVRIGNCVRQILSEEPAAIVVRFHGSFATTYKGHGSDKAIIAGLLGFKADDERVKRSLEIAKERGITYEFKKIELSSNAHPNTLVVDITTNNNKRLQAIGESVGGGNFIIRRLNDTDVEFNGQFDTLIIDHRDAPGAVALVTSLLTAERLNIAGMRVFRSRKGGNSIMIIETDGAIDSALAEVIGRLPNINSSTFIPGLLNSLSRADTGGAS